MTSIRVCKYTAECVRSGVGGHVETELFICCVDGRNSVHVVEVIVKLSVQSPEGACMQISVRQQRLAALI